MWSQTQRARSDLASSFTRGMEVRVLSGLSKKFHSFALVELASRARSDPFGKVGGGIVSGVSCVVRGRMCFAICRP